MNVEHPQRNTANKLPASQTPSGEPKCMQALREELKNMLAEADDAANEAAAESTKLKASVAQTEEKRQLQLSIEAARAKRDAALQRVFLLADLVMYYGKAGSR